MTYNLNFEGFWNIDKINFIPTCKGIFVVFAARLKTDNQDIIQSLHPIFIGTSKNIKASINQTHSIIKWQRYLKPNEQLYFNSAYIKEKTDIQNSIVSELVILNHPLLNEKFEEIKTTKSDAFKIKCTGMCFGLKDSFS